jgi:hypothetical protein
MEYDFWPRGDDTYSRAARQLTIAALFWTVVIVASAFALARLFTC